MSSLTCPVLIVFMSTSKQNDAFLLLCMQNQLLVYGKNYMTVIKRTHAAAYSLFLEFVVIHYPQNKQKIIKMHVIVLMFI